MEISVTITTCNRPERLATGLGALSQQDFALQDIEVIVADNGDPAQTKKVADHFAPQFPNFQYLHDPRPGQLVGWHRALAISRGEVACFIDDDAVPEQGWLGGLADAYADHRVGLVTGPIRPDYESSPPDWVDDMTLGERDAETMPVFGLLDFGDGIREIPGNFVWGTNFSARRHCVVEAGGFHPCAMPGHLLKFYGDGEVAVGRAIEAAGHRVLYHPAVAVRHSIPKFRFTDAAIKSKFFTSGCARSFQTLRQSGEAYADPTREEIDDIAIRYFRDGSDGPTGLRDIVGAGLQDGIMAHLTAFKKDAAFRNWVLQDNYLDLDRCYVHPELVPVTNSRDDWRAGASAVSNPGRG